MNNTKDDELEKFLSKIKESNNSHNKLLNYQKASNRIDELKTEYKKLCSVLKPKKDKTTKNKQVSQGKISIEKIINELNKINTDMDSEECDMLELINSYTQYKLLLENMETETEKIKNELHKVSQNKNKIVIEKIELDDIL